MTYYNPETPNPGSWPLPPVHSAKAGPGRQKGDRSPGFRKRFTVLICFRLGSEIAVLLFLFKVGLTVLGVGFWALGFGFRVPVGV